MGKCEPSGLSITEKAQYRQLQDVLDKHALTPKEVKDKIKHTLDVVQRKLDVYDQTHNDYANTAQQDSCYDQENK